MERKYELIKDDVINYIDIAPNKENLKECDPIYLYRIKALKDFGNVHKGDLGGYIEDEENLSHEGECWVYDNSTVSGFVTVEDNSMIIHSKIDSWGRNNSITIKGESAIIFCNIYAFEYYKKECGKTLSPYNTKNLIEDSCLNHVDISMERRGMFEFINSNIWNANDFYSQFLIFKNCNIDFKFINDKTNKDYDDSAFYELNSYSSHILGCNIFMDINIDDSNKAISYYNNVFPFNRNKEYLTLSFIKNENENFFRCFVCKFFRNEKYHTINSSTTKCIIDKDVNVVKEYINKYIYSSKSFNRHLKYFMDCAKEETENYIF